MRRQGWLVTRAAPAVALAAVALLAGPGARAQETTPFDIQVAPVTVAPGEMGTALITLVIHQDYRLIGEPAPNKFSTTLTVTFDATRALQPRAAIYPEPQVFKETVQAWSYSAYEGTILVKMPFKADEHAPEGNHTMHGRIRFQALIIDDQGLAGFLKTAVKMVDVTVRVAPRKK